VISDCAQYRDNSRIVVPGAFYNPTWNLLGDANGPPGTYYWRNGREEAGWYVLDHVLLRPKIVSRLRTP